MKWYKLTAIKDMPRCEKGFSHTFNERQINSIGAMPSAQPERKNVMWIDNKCTACGKGIENLIDSREWYENEKPNYCPFCGKKFEKSGK